MRQRFGIEALLEEAAIPRPVLCPDDIKALAQLALSFFLLTDI